MSTSDSALSGENAFQGSTLGTERDGRSQRRHTARFKILIDFDCPLCVREASFLRRLDRGRGRLLITNIADPEFEPAAFGTTQERIMGTIHGVLPDGKVVKGMEVFRRAYAAVGFGWLLAPTDWPGIKQVVDSGYRWFARNRLRLAGRRSCGDGSCMR